VNVCLEPKADSSVSKTDVAVQLSGDVLMAKMPVVGKRLFGLS